MLGNLAREVAPGAARRATSNAFSFYASAVTDDRAAIKFSAA